MTSFERDLLAHFIRQLKEDMRKIWLEAVNNQQTSGNLLEAYRINFKLIWNEYI